MEKFKRNVYQGPIDTSAPAEVYNRPSLSYNPPRATPLNRIYEVYKRSKSRPNKQTTTTTAKPQTRNINTRWSKMVDEYSFKPTVNKELPETVVTLNKNKQTTTTTANAATSTTTSKPAGTTAKTNAAKPTRLVSRNSNNDNYTIEKGDTLYDIAKRYTGDGNNYKELLKHNNIKDTNSIYVGDKLNIPDSWRKKSDIKKKTAFSLPKNLDEDYAQIQRRESGKW